MMNHKFIISVALLVLSGCQTTPVATSGGSGVTYSGESHADQVLRSDTTKMVKLIASGQGCKNIEHINTKVLHSEPRNGQKDHVWGKEGWMATGCGKPYPFFVTFKEDGNGGTLFTLKPAKR